MNKTVLLVIAAVLCGAGLSSGQARNPGLLNVLEVQPSGHLGVHGDVERVTMYEDEIISWLEEAMNDADFGAARWTGTRSDSIAYLDVNVQIVPHEGETMLTTAIFQVLRPGFVLDVPADESVFDVPVMHTAYTLSGDEAYLRQQLRSLIQQFIHVTAERIRQHNPE